MATKVLEDEILEALERIDSIKQDTAYRRGGGRGGKARCSPRSKARVAAEGTHRDGQRVQIGSA
jgi:hypothetical protein